MPETNLRDLSAGIGVWFERRAAPIGTWHWNDPRFYHHQEPSVRTGCGTEVRQYETVSHWPALPPSGAVTCEECLTAWRRRMHELQVERVLRESLARIGEMG